jgi:glycosyltransferase involved in cell wall biosynthesis
LVKHRPHVVHVHDLLALRSALGLVPENPTSWSGQIYQRYIRSGFKKAKHFISISRKTRHDLHQHGQVSPVISEVVYNGLNFPFAPMAPDDAFRHLDRAGLPVKRDGMLLHVSGSQWYKNMPGLIRLYAEYARRLANPLPLWCISPNPSAPLQTLLEDVPPQGRVFFFQGLGNESLEAAYSLARVFLLPSHAEGFGWPIIEAQACGCPVITTGEPPMNEVGGPATRFLPRLRINSDVNEWAMNGAAVLIEVLSMNDSDRIQASQRGIAWAARFDADAAIAGYLNIYTQILP